MLYLPRGIIDSIIGQIQEEVQEILNDIQSSLQNLMQILGNVGFIVAEITNFFATISQLINSELFNGYVFNDFLEFFTGKLIFIRS